ncbi:MAG: flagellar biosynthetic protein FliO [Hyphomicrobiaceae bacterium]
MLDLLFYVVMLALFALLVVGGLWLVRGYTGGQSPMTALFGERPEKRLAVVEHASVDGRRRLVLIRRDDVEHLIMTGGPVDVVIETGIGPASTSVPKAEVATANFARPARTFGRVQPQAQDVAE